MSTPTSLRTKLTTAATEQEITDLLNEGAKYEFACKKTRNRWKVAARKRLNFLKGVKDEPAPVVAQPSEIEEVSMTKKEAKKKRWNKKKPAETVAA